MKVRSENFGSGSETKTVVSWDRDGCLIEKKYSSVARCIFIEEKNKIFVSVYLERKIFAYNLDGDELNVFDLPEKKGYPYRGLNRNKKSVSGAAFLFVPVGEGCGNQWKDIEQFELLESDDPLGDFIDIYR